jgi:F-type H+-transporting ATPase subunit a
VGGVLSVFFGVLWKSFDLAIGLIQAFIFALLTVLYFGMAAGHGEPGEEHDEHGAADDADTTQEAEPEFAA